MTEIVIRSGGKNGKGDVPYRAVTASYTPEDPEKGILWFLEYQLMPDREWRPRGSFYEKDGVFDWGGNKYSSAEAVLEARIAQGP